LHEVDAKFASAPGRARNQKNSAATRAENVAEDACFSQSGHSAGSIADEFRAAGVDFDPAKKADRLTGWSTMRRLLARRREA
jgi:hypothetical protein